MKYPTSSSYIVLHSTFPLHTTTELFHIVARLQACYGHKITLDDATGTKFIFPQFSNFTSTSLTHTDTRTMLAAKGQHNFFLFQQMPSPQLLLQQTQQTEKYPIFTSLPSPSRDNFAHSLRNDHPPQCYHQLHRCIAFLLQTFLDGKN